jgi:hypothetical protein
MNLPNRFCFLLVTFLGGCSEPATRTTDIAPPPPLPAKVQEVAVARGKAIAVETFNLLSTNLQLALQSGGISNALPFCSLAASPLTANMAEKYGVTLRRITHKARNPAAQADALELSILNSFAAALTTTTNPPPAFATNLVLNQVTFFAPIVIHHELCLQCHGEPGQDLTAENLALIRYHYPQDQATGFKLRQLRGAWRIDFPLTAFAGDSTP